MSKITCILAVCWFLAGNFAWGQMAGENRMVILEPEQFAWKAVPSLPPGAEMAVIEGDLRSSRPFTFRLRLPDDYIIPPHTHPAVERVTVLSGTLYLGEGTALDYAATRILPAGSIAILPQGMAMYAFTEGETILQLHGEGPWDIVYANPAEDPRR
jgi:hypothetical protein